MEKNDNKITCEHGSLRRQCLICELQSDIAELKKEIAAKNQIIRDLSEVIAMEREDESPR